MTILVTRGTLVQLAEVLIAGAVVFGLLAAWRRRRDVPWRRAATSCGILVGLALVARFAELHGGRAWVEDRPGGGASFKVFLPRKPPTA